MLAAQVVRAESPAEEVAAATKKLGESANYSWTTTTTVPESARFRPGATEGKVEKDGCVMLKIAMGERTSESVIKAGKVVVKTEDGWKTGEELEAARSAGGGGGGGPGGGRGPGGGFAARMAQNFKAPAAEVEALVKGVKELKKEGDVISGDLTDEAVKERLTFGGRRGGRGGNEGGGDRPAPPEPQGAKGAVKIWLKEGAVTKYELSMEGKVTFGENEIDLQRTITTEIKDVGTTKLEVPDEVKQKLDAAKTEAPKPEAPKTETPKPAEPAKEA